MSSEQAVCDDLPHHALYVAGRLGIRLPSRGRYGHICALCLHASSQHGDTTGSGVYDCPCGCQVGSDLLGFWLGEKDFRRWVAEVGAP